MQDRFWFPASPSLVSRDATSHNISIAGSRASRVRPTASASLRQFGHVSTLAETTEGAGQRPERKEDSDAEVCN